MPAGTLQGHAKKIRPVRIAHSYPSSRNLLARLLSAEPALAQWTWTGCAGGVKSRSQPARSGLRSCTHAVASISSAMDVNSAPGEGTEGPPQQS